MLWAAPGAFAAGWCGSGESPIDRPDATTGRQVHAVVALPSDVPDTFPADAGRLADDVASVTAWWQGQDPTRVPRFDTAVFPGGTCLDISFLRLPDPATSYSLASASDAALTFTTVVRQLTAAGLDDQYKRYLVYVDGVGAATDLVCGTGEGQFYSGPAYALVWLQTCAQPTPVPKDSVAAHELLHALGALPDGAPHACPGDAGHPCDSPTDVLYPYTTGAPLASLVLDFGHDDYYGHSGSWLDIQDSQWLHLLAAPQVPLTLTFVGGPGLVESDVPGIECTTTCTTQWDAGSTIHLFATPADGFRFVRFAGAGCPDDQVCRLSLSSAAAVVAVFGPARIAVRRTVLGRGRIVCTPACGATVAAGVALRLHAVPAHGWRFVAWGGVCRGTVPVCRPGTQKAFGVRARFRRLPATRSR